MITDARCLGAVFGIFLISALCSADAQAEVPPASVVESRLASAREAASDLDVEIDIEMTGEDAGSISSFTMLGKRAATSDDNAFGWKLLLVVLTSSDPWSDIENLAGSIDTSVTDIATRDDAFIYAYGDNPQISVSRDLSVIRSVRIERNATRWKLVASGRLEGTPMPERVVLLENGRPVARVELSLPEDDDD